MPTPAYKRQVVAQRLRKHIERYAERPGTSGQYQFIHKRSWPEGMVKGWYATPPKLPDVPVLYDLAVRENLDLHWVLGVIGEDDQPLLRQETPVTTSPDAALRAALAAEFARAEGTKPNTIAAILPRA